MKFILKNLAVKVFQSILDLLVRLTLFLALISPLIIWKLPLIKQIAGNNIYLSSTGFHIPDLLTDSLGTSLILILCSLVISTYFGLVISLAGTFDQELAWLPFLMVIVSTIPIFITAYYLPYIIFAVLLSVVLISLAAKPGKPGLPIGLTLALILAAVVTISYLNRVGSLELIRQTRDLPILVLNNFDSILQSSILISENILPIAGFILSVAVFGIYLTKYPIYSSLVITLFVGFLMVYGVVVYGYNAKIEDTYLLAPILTLSIGNLVLGLFINQLQEGIKEQLQFPYIKAAVAKGASLWNHLQKKILLIILHSLKSQFPLLLSLTIIVEKIYNLEGIGYLTWEYAMMESDLLTVAWIIGLCFLLVWVFNQLMDTLIFLVFPKESSR